MGDTVLPLTHRRNRSHTRRELRKIVRGLLFVSPWLIGFLWLTLYPMLASLYYSFTDFQILGDPSWIGLANYQEMFFKDKLFWLATSNTVWYALVSVPLGTVFSIGLALLLNTKVRGMAIYRTVFYVPTVVPTIASVMLWAWVLNPTVGPINYILSLLGMQGPGWFNDPNWSKPALVVLSLWSIGASMVIYLASLQDIPRSLYEAAALDGANGAQQIWHITIPLLTPTILFNVVMGLIGAFQFFSQAFVGGAVVNGPGSNTFGPLNSLLFYNLYLYQNAFSYYRMGYASALAWVLLVLVLAVTLALFRSTGRWIQYGR